VGILQDAFTVILSEILKEPPSNVFFFASQRLKEMGEERLRGAACFVSTRSNLVLRLRRRPASAHGNRAARDERGASDAEGGDGVPKEQRCALVTCASSLIARRPFPLSDALAAAAAAEEPRMPFTALLLRVLSRALCALHAVPDSTEQKHIEKIQGAYFSAKKSLSRARPSRRACLIACRLLRRKKKVAGSGSSAELSPAPSPVAAKSPSPGASKRRLQAEQQAKEAAAAAAAAAAPAAAAEPAQEPSAAVAAAKPKKVLRFSFCSVCSHRGFVQTLAKRQSSDSKALPAAEAPKAAASSAPAEDAKPAAKKAAKVRLGLCYCF
jgi:hypothetical protein